MDTTIQEGDNYSVKKLLFYRAIPPYAPEVTNVKNLFYCMDCGDRFFFDSSYEQHINRKSLKITYNCRYCQVLPCKTFYNRCKFLAHIRSHSYKTATINVTDLKIEPLPPDFFQLNRKTPTLAPKQSTITCIECNEIIIVTNAPNRHWADHYMKFALGSTGFSCPVCHFILPNTCALKAHLRIHLRIPPYVCPECGIYLLHKHINYPYNHNCEGFKLMRATARVKCAISKCQLFHPNNFPAHMKKEHLKKVFKCPFCFTACFSQLTLNRHVSLAHHHLNQSQSNAKATTSKSNIFYQCEICPGRLVLQSHFDSHLISHIQNHVYPCWVCGIVFDKVINLIEHHIDSHSNNDDFKNIYQSLTSNRHEKEANKVYRVVKKCGQCTRTFSYRCSFDEINVLPNLCPYNCTSLEDGSHSQDTPDNIKFTGNEVQTEPNILRNINLEDSNVPHSNSNAKIMCTLCNIKIDSEWEAVKEHYAVSHKEHKCVDVKISIPKIDPKDYLFKKQAPKYKRSKGQRRKTVKKITKNELADPVSTTPPKSKLTCNICHQVFPTNEQLVIHLKSHRDPCMAYQCLECGQSFVVKPSFTMHLLLEHDITNVEQYIEEKQCYNDNALTLDQQCDSANGIPTKENQCTICREQFDNTDDLQKHFRVHGMAFLIKNSQIKPVVP